MNDVRNQQRREKKVIGNKDFKIVMLVIFALLFVALLAYFIVSVVVGIGIGDALSHFS